MRATAQQRILVCLVLHTAKPYMTCEINFWWTLKKHAVNASALSAGTYAEHFSVKESYLAHQPASLKFEEAGGVPLAALTAYQVSKGQCTSDHIAA